jgi:hypothetical protein
MAMISCPECGKQVSDKAETCPNCGYPLYKMGYDDDLKPFDVDELPRRTEHRPHVAPRVKKKKRGHKGVIIALIIVVLAIGAGAFGYVNFIPNKYEKAVIACGKEYKKALKNPDSLKVSNIMYYSGLDKNQEEAFESFEYKDEMQNLIDSSTEAPIIVFTATGENSYGGSASSTLIYAYASEDGKEYAVNIYSSENDEGEAETYGKTVGSMSNFMNDYSDKINLKKVNRLIHMD